MSKKAVILISGGLDSTTCLAIAKAEGYDCYALSFDYGQKHRIELTTAAKIATSYQVVEHRLIQLDLMGSALTDQDKKVPDHCEDGEIPSTYVPARNTIFLSIALSWAEAIGARDIFYGANCVDYSGYVDCRPEYINAFETLANLATKAGVEGDRFRICAPLLHLKKEEIIQKGIELGVDYSKTISCYRPNTIGEACGTCDSCFYRKKGFTDAGVADPTHYFK